MPTTGGTRRAVARNQLRATASPRRSQPAATYAAEYRMPPRSHPIRSLFRPKQGLPPCRGRPAGVERADPWQDCAGTGLDGLLNRVGARLGALAVLLARAAGDANRAHDLAIGDQRH